MYATVTDLRAEGVTEAQASSERLDDLIEEATLSIDRYTGWFFEPRARTYRLDGRGTPTIEPPAPPIRLDRLAVNEQDLPLEPGDLVVVGAPPAASAPRLTLRNGRVFSKGTGNVVATGVWGYTEDDGSLAGRVPLEIRRACMLMVLGNLAPLANAESDARHRWRILSERTKDQSVSFGRVTPGPFTGDPEIDDILLRYRRPVPMGAA